MVADDLASSQSEDPLPRRTDPDHFSAVSSTAAPSAAPNSSENSVHRTAPQVASATGDTSAGQVPLWSRLPRSIWLMSTLALASLQVLQLLP